MIEVGYVLVNNTKKIKHFASIIMFYEGRAEFRWNGYIIDATSILGLFSLDIRNPLLLYVSDNTSESYKELIHNLKEGGLLKVDN